MGRYLKSCLHQEWLERFKAVKTVSDEPGACLDKPTVSERTKPSSINDNEPRGSRAKQVETAATHT